ncbi:hypothetical protein ACA910_005444 [Epithemia clementina (nom. ined.)]
MVDRSSLYSCENTTFVTNTGCSSSNATTTTNVSNTPNCRSKSTMSSKTKKQALASISTLSSSSSHHHENQKNAGGMLNKSSHHGGVNTKTKTSSTNTKKNPKDLISSSSSHQQEHNPESKNANSNSQQHDIKTSNSDKRTRRSSAPSTSTPRPQKEHDHIDYQNHPRRQSASLSSAASSLTVRSVALLCPSSPTTTMGAILENSRCSSHNYDNTKDFKNKTKGNQTKKTIAQAETRNAADSCPSSAKDALVILPSSPKRWNKPLLKKSIRSSKTSPSDPSSSPCEDPPKSGTIGALNSSNKDGETIAYQDSNTTFKQNSKSSTEKTKKKTATQEDSTTRISRRTTDRSASRCRHQQRSTSLNRTSTPSFLGPNGTASILDGDRTRSASMSRAQSVRLSKKKSKDTKQKDHPHNKEATSTSSKRHEQEQDMASMHSAPSTPATQRRRFRFTSRESADKSASPSKATKTNTIKPKKYKKKYFWDPPAPLAGKDNVDDDNCGYDGEADLTEVSMNSESAFSFMEEENEDLITPVPSFEQLVAVDRSWNWVQKKTAADAAAALSPLEEYRHAVLGGHLVQRILAQKVAASSSLREAKELQEKLSELRGSERFQLVAKLLVIVVEIIVSLMGPDLEEFREELAELGEQCTSEGIPISLLGNAVSEAIQIFLTSNDEHQQLDEGTNYDSSSSGSCDDDLSLFTYTTTTTCFSTKHKKFRFTENHRQAWKVVVDFASLKMASSSSSSSSMPPSPLGSSISALPF